MNGAASDVIIGVMRDALVLGFKMAAPMLVTSLVVGFAISLLQSITQLQEQTISFVPKLVAVALAMLITGHWLITTIVDFTTQLYTSIPSIVHAV